MGCQEMKEKKKEPLDNPKKIEEETDGKNQEDKKEEKPQEEINIIENENNINQIEENNILFSAQENNINEDEKIKSLIQIDQDPYIPNYLGKLCFAPISLFVYDLQKKVFHIQNYKIEENNNLEKLNSSSSYCNGDNKLFVSGGISNEGEIIDNLWIFDLINYDIELISNLAPKNNHSLIYIPSNYIFLVGGNDEKVLYYDIQEKKIELWEELNKKRLEPALIQINDYLYVFDNVNKSGDNIEISFERTNLLASKPKFELITPQLSENISGSIIPKFFGAAKESEESIIFLGGNILDEQDDNKDIKNYKYNIIDNKIEFSEVPFVNIQLKEKNFFNYNNKNDIYLILPDFYRKVPKVAFYIKSKNIIKIVDYMPNVISPKKENNMKEDSKENAKFKSYNFNMPKNKENISDNIINN